MLQDTVIATMECEYEIVPKLSNVSILNELEWPVAQISRSWLLGRRPLGTVLHSPNEPDELSQWLYHDDSTLNIVLELLLLLLFWMTLSDLAKY